MYVFSRSSRQKDLKRMKNIFVVRGLSFFVVLAICTAFAANRNAALAANLLAHSRLPVSVADIPEAAALRTAPRIALVVGNDHYKQWPSLRQPTADAGAMARSLYARGFELVGGGPQLDVSSDRFHQLLADTAAAVRANPGAIVVTYFSGHGFAANGAS
ncbi:MAG TPA: caspase family protein, partial [Candidatus Binataceae bacterium]|nr:caspase family protein [Candidatus Binataceae bacterium]